MKRLFIFLLATSLLTACKDKAKTTPEKDREKDDYGTVDENKDNTKDGGAFAKTGGEEWTDADKKTFYQQCETTMEGKDVPSTFCSCVFEKAKVKYSSMKEMDEKSTEEEGKRWATACINESKGNSGDDAVTNNTQPNNTGGGWPETEIQSFVKACVVKAQKNGLEYLDAQSYCDCMQYKIEQLYPNIADAARITEADLETPAMKKLIKGCLPGN